MSSVAEVTSAASATNEAEVANLPFVKVDEARIQEQLDDVVRRTVEETLNALLDWMRRRTSYAGRSGTSVVRRGATRGRDTTAGTCTPRRGRSS
jgi:multidrug efflux pump subunit AcrA (membrane-fusion protein)